MSYQGQLAGAGTISSITVLRQRTALVPVTANVTFIGAHALLLVAVRACKLRCSRLMFLAADVCG